MSISAARKGTLLALGGAFAAAAFLIPYKAAGARAPREVIVMAMLVAAAVLNTMVVLSGFVRLGGPRRRVAPARSARLVVLVSLLLAAFTAVGNIASAEALARIDAGLTSVAQQTQVLFVAGAAALFLGERITLRFALGAAIALAGFAVMRLPGDSAVHLAGILWAVLSALCFGSMQVITRQVIHRIDPVPVNALRLWLSVAVLACLPGRLAALLTLDAGAWALAAAAAFCGPFLGRISFMYAVRHIAASHSILLGLASPLFAFGLGYLAFGTVPGLFEIVGGALILAGIVLPVLELVANERPLPALARER